MLTNIISREKRKIKPLPSLDEKNPKVIGIMEKQLLFKLLDSIAPTLEENIEKVESCQFLKYNWDKKNGFPFSKRIINKTKGLLSELNIQPEVSPTGRNSFYFQYALPNKSFITFEISEKFLYIVTVPYGVYNESSENTSRNISSDYINSKLDEFVKKYG